MRFVDAVRTHAHKEAINLQKGATTERGIGKREKERERERERER